MVSKRKDFLRDYAKHYNAWKIQCSDIWKKKNNARCSQKFMARQNVSSLIKMVRPFCFPNPTATLIEID